MSAVVRPVCYNPTPLLSSDFISKSPTSPTNLARRNGRADTVHREEFLQLAAYVRPVADRFRRRRQSLEHRRPVAFGNDATIQQHHRTDIRFGADQPPKSLFQLE